MEGTVALSPNVGCIFLPLPCGSALVFLCVLDSGISNARARFESRGNRPGGLDSVPRRGRFQFRWWLPLATDAGSRLEREPHTKDDDDPCRCVFADGDSRSVEPFSVLDHHDDLGFHLLLDLLVYLRALPAR